MRQRTAAIVGGAVAALAIIVVAGFAVRGQDVSCTASLAVPSLSIVVSGATSQVDGVEVCAGDPCSFRDGPTASPTPDADGGLPAGVGPATPGSTTPVYAHRIDTTHWTIAFYTSRPDRMDVAVRGDGGAILVSKPEVLHWKQVGPTSVCGNPHTTPPIHLLVPTT